eukprot:scaffold2857_cov344-Pavlova_lutheri.AAC.7
MDCGRGTCLFPVAPEIGAIGRCLCCARDVYPWARCAPLACRNASCSFRCNAMKTRMFDG